MAEAKNTVPGQGDHDRVAMLSLKADGTPDQHDPELIGDRDTALAAAKRQFAEQAVSAADIAERGVVAEDGGEQVGQDPQVEQLTKAHEDAAAAAESAAEATVKALHGEQPEAKAPAATEKAPASKAKN